ncbi:MAG: 2-oxoacid:ferredoxin oxidoreductase subunit beta [Firmicutes bacterium]|nr:2-oxoacid:ferredoxin oxidoreductase subunit beta [Bacillota bacterium]
MLVDEAIYRYLREDKLPLMWCPGCGNGIILKTIVRAMAELALDPTKTVVVTGIGCWGKADDYLGVHTLHCTHGRALAYATGIKAARPELKVIVLMGDGDAATIGGNHLIHAARRNIDLTAIVSNNYNYGMTGGQYSGTTPLGSITTTSQYGTVEEGFDLCNLVIGAGGSYVARGTVFHVKELKRILVEAIRKKGFSFVDVINNCPTHFGRNNKMGGPKEMMHRLKEIAVSRQTWERLSAAEKKGKLVIGELLDINQPEFTDRYAALRQRAQGNGGGVGTFLR